MPHLRAVSAACGGSHGAGKTPARRRGQRRRRCSEAACPVLRCAAHLAGGARPAAAQHFPAPRNGSALLTCRAGCASAVGVRRRRRARACLLNRRVRGGAAVGAVRRLPTSPGDAARWRRRWDAARWRRSIGFAESHGRPRLPEAVEQARVRRLQHEAAQGPHAAAGGVAAAAAARSLSLPAQRLCASANTLQPSPSPLRWPPLLQLRRRWRLRPPARPRRAACRSQARCTLLRACAAPAEPRCSRASLAAPRERAASSSPQRRMERWSESVRVRWACVPEAKPLYAGTRYTRADASAFRRRADLGTTNSAIAAIEGGKARAQRGAHASSADAHL